MRHKMKKLLLASVVLALASLPGYAAEEDVPSAEAPAPNPSVVVRPPPYIGPPPLGWVYGPYTSCANPPQCSMGVVNVQADGLNVRAAPDGPATLSLTNGTVFYPVQKEGDWMLVVPACDLTPAFGWSITAGVPLYRCWVYF